MTQEKGTCAQSQPCSTILSESWGCTGNHGDEQGLSLTHDFPAIAYYSSRVVLILRGNLVPWVQDTEAACWEHHTEKSLLSTCVCVQPETQHLDSQLYFLFLKTIVKWCSSLYDALSLLLFPLPFIAVMTRITLMLCGGARQGLYTCWQS